MTRPQGLRRFTGTGPAQTPGGSAGPLPRGTGAEPGPPVPDTGRPADLAGEHCEFCATAIPATHGHVADVEQSSLMCACRACYLLFTSEGAARGRYRAVPERICRDPDRPLAAADWNELQIPVTMAFFFYNSALGRVVAGYPSPGGVTECELDLAAWDRLATAYPLLAELAPDTEAIFVNQDEVFLIPVDMCYSLVGELRLYWQGFDGGAEARAALEKFLSGLRQRAVALAPVTPADTAIREGEH